MPAMKSTTAQTVSSWLYQPSSWISLVAALISVTTFFLVYAYRGEVRVIIPDRIGVALTSGDLSVLMPLTLTNTGAPRTARHIVRISATLEGIAPLQGSPATINVRWRMELKYAKSNDTNYMHDKLVYVNRAIPFALFGGTSTQRVFELVQDS